MTELPTTHDELAHHLAMFLSSADPNGRGRLTWENIEMPDCDWVKGKYIKCRPDVFSINATLNPNNVCPITYEIKNSRQDFLADVRYGKWRNYYNFSAYVYFAAHEGILTKADIPDGAGFIVLMKDGKWYKIKRGRKNKIWRMPERIWLNLCLKGRNPSPREVWLNNQYS